MLLYGRSGMRRRCVLLCVDERVRADSERLRPIVRPTSRPSLFSRETGAPHAVRWSYYREDDRSVRPRF